MPDNMTMGAGPREVTVADQIRMEQSSQNESIFMRLRDDFERASEDAQNLEDALYACKQRREVLRAALTELDSDKPASTRG